MVYTRAADTGRAGVFIKRREDKSRVGVGEKGVSASAANRGSNRGDSGTDAHGLSSDTGFVRHGDAGGGVEEEVKGSRCGGRCVHGTAVLFDKGQGSLVSGHSTGGAGRSGINHAVQEVTKG